MIPSKTASNQGSTRVMQTAAGVSYTSQPALILNSGGPAAGFMFCSRSTGWLGLMWSSVGLLMPAGSAEGCHHCYHCGTSSMHRMWLAQELPAHCSAALAAAPAHLHQQWCWSWPLLTRQGWQQRHTCHSAPCTHSAQHCHDCASVWHRPPPHRLGSCQCP
jgi:hypothetical protein